MNDMLYFSPPTGDEFNPIIVIAIGAVCLIAVFLLLFSGKGRK